MKPQLIKRLLEIREEMRTVLPRIQQLRSELQPLEEKFASLSNEYHRIDETLAESKIRIVSSKSQPQTLTDLVGRMSPQNQRTLLDLLKKQATQLQEKTG